MTRINKSICEKLKKIKKKIASKGRLFWKTDWDYVLFFLRLKLCLVCELDVFLFKFYVQYKCCLCRNVSFIKDIYKNASYTQQIDTITLLKTIVIYNWNNDSLCRKIQNDFMLQMLSQLRCIAKGKKQWFYREVMKFFSYIVHWLVSIHTIRTHLQVQVPIAIFLIFLQIDIPCPSYVVPNPT